MSDRRTAITELLQGSELLRSIPESDLEELAAHVHRSHHKANELIFTKRDEGSSVMFVAAGRVKIVSVSPEGGEVILNIIEPGQVFGEMAILDGKPRSADAVAAVDTDVVTLYRRDFLPVLRRSPDASFNMMLILCDRIRQATSFVEDAVLSDAPTRLFNRLKALALQYGVEQADGSIRIEHGLSQQEIGDSVGLTRVSVNRILGAWREAGLIEDGRRYIVVRDFDALEEFVHSRRSR